MFDIPSFIYMFVVKKNEIIKNLIIMNKNTVVRLSFLFILFLVSGNIVLGQSAGKNFKLRFSRGADGSIATINAVGQRVFNFAIEGIANKKQADDFEEAIKSNPHVAYVTLNEHNDKSGLWQGVFVLDKKTKLPDFKTLLSNMGFTGVYVDGVLVAIEDLEILKTNSIKKPYKQN